MQRLLEVLLQQFSDLDALCMLSLSEKILLTPIAVRKGIKTFWIEHDRVSNWLTKNPWLQNLLRLSNAVTTIVVSELSRKIYLDLGWNAARIIAIPNGIKDALTSPSPSPADGRGEHIGCIARLTKDKGVDVLIQAIADLPEISLTIVGKGREEGFIRNLIAEITVREHLAEPRIRLIPTLPDLHPFYASMDVLVLPSREHDPFGLVAAEAMSKGIPTIVTDACGIASYLENGKEAIIVKADDVRALQGAIETLRDPVKRQEIATFGKRAAEAKFSLEKMIQSYETIFQESR